MEEIVYEAPKTENKITPKKVYETLKRYLDTIDRNAYKPRSKRIRPSLMEELIDNIMDLIRLYMTFNEENTAEICKKRVIPQLKMVIKMDKDVNRRAKYLDYAKECYLYAARHDFESFIIYYEWEKRDKFYLPRMEIFSGFCYYLNKMVLDPTFEGIIANYPSGAGKTYITTLASAWSYGIDASGTILALCSNIDVVTGGSRTVKEIIQSPEFGEVFPKLRWDKNDKDYYKKDTEGEWKLKDCKLLASYYAKTTASNVVGCRASKWVWIDDLYADYKEALNEQDNVYLFNKFLTVWRKRFIQEAPIQKFIITGTMWSPTDFIVKTINWLKEDKNFIDHPQFPFVKISDDGKFAIIQVPALNNETNKSNCENIFKTKTLLNEKKSLDSYIWECNFQQNPVSPEALAFDWKNLKVYTSTLINEYGSTYSVIDGTRKSGKDYFSMPIFQPYMTDYALVDCLFTQTATSRLHDAIVDKIIQNNIKMLVIETNVDGGLKTVIKEKLEERGFDNGIQIIEKYSTMVKQTRIELERGNILDRIYFPDQRLFALNSDMGKFMANHTMYNIEGNNTHDDATDSLAMFTSEIISDKAKGVKPIILRRPF